MTRLKSHAPAGCEKHGTGRCGDTSMSSSGRFSVEMINQGQAIGHQPGTYSDCYCKILDGNIIIIISWDNLHMAI